MRTPSRVHRVGLLASVVGVAALLFGSLGVSAPFRISSGTTRSVFEAVPLPVAAIPFGLWAVVVVLSVRSSGSRRLALVRGWMSVAIVLTVLSLVGSAAASAIAPGDTVARYSIGGGAWLTMLASFALLMATRREIGATSRAAVSMTAALPSGIMVLVLSGALSRLGMAAEYRNVSEDFWGWVGLHVGLSAVAVAVAVTVATSLGIAAHRNRRIADPIFAATSLFQTIPGLAMIGILAVPLGMATGWFPALRRAGIGTIGWAPVLVALTLYALLVIVRNTYAGLNSVPEATVEAALGMGLTRGQVLRKVQLPLAAPVLFSGIRTAVQQTIGNATLGVFVAAATLGRPIFGGVSQTADDLTLLGSVTLVALAVSADITFRSAERLLTPAHVKGGGS